MLRLQWNSTNRWSGWWVLISIGYLRIFAGVLLFWKLIAKDMIGRVHVIDGYLCSQVMETGACKIWSRVMSGRRRIDTQEAVPDCYNALTLYWSLWSVPNNKLYWHSPMNIQASSLWIAFWQGRASWFFIRYHSPYDLYKPSVYLTSLHMIKSPPVILHTVSKQILEVVKD